MRFASTNITFSCDCYWPYCSLSLALSHSMRMQLILSDFGVELQKFSIKHTCFILAKTSEQLKQSMRKSISHMRAHFSPRSPHQFNFKIQPKLSNGVGGGGDLFWRHCIALYVDNTLESNAMRLCVDCVRS